MASEGAGAVAEGDLSTGGPTGLPAQLGPIAVGLVLLVGGSEAIVSAAVAFARPLGLSDVAIGLTSLRLAPHCLRRQRRSQPL